MSVAKMESEENKYGKSRVLPQYIAALSVCLGSVAAGTVLGWSANITTDLEDGKLNNIAISKDEMSWVGAIMNVGALIICAPIGYICDLIGRKWANLLLIIPFTIGWILIICASNLGMVLAGRFFTGFAGGAFCVSAPLYTSEIAQKEIRGALGSFFQLLLTVGIFIAYILGSKYSHLTIVQYSIICACFPLIFGVVFFFQPETPYHSVKKGRDEDALKALRKLRGPDWNSEEELKDIKRQIGEDAQNKLPLMRSFETVAAKKAAMICFGLMLFQQLSGINAVIFYTNDIFKAAGTKMDPDIQTIIVGVIQIIATLISTLVVDRFGRKILLLISDGMMAFSAFLLGVYFTLKDDVKLDSDTIVTLGFLPILSVCIFISVFSLGYGPIPWMMSSEVSPPEIKSTLSSIGGTFNWFLAFLVTKFFSNLDDVIHGNTFYLFAAISTLGTVYVYFVCIETKGKSFAEIQNDLKGSSRYDMQGNVNQAFN